MSDKPIDLVAVLQGRENLAALVERYPNLTSPEAQSRLAAHLSVDTCLTPVDSPATLDTMPSAERHTVNIRLDDPLVEALDAAAEVAPVLSRHAICRVALHIGLAAVIDDPTLLLKPPPGASAKKAKKKRAASK